MKCPSCSTHAIVPYAHRLVWYPRCSNCGFLYDDVFNSEEEVRKAITDNCIYVPTDQPGTKPSLEVGQSWHLRRAGKWSLFEVKILELTPRTALVKFKGPVLGRDTLRIAVLDADWVELAKGSDADPLETGADIDPAAVDWWQ